MTDVIKQHEAHVEASHKKLGKTISTIRRRLRKKHVPTYVDSIMFVTMMGLAGEAARRLLISTQDREFVDRVVDKFKKDLCSSVDTGSALVQDSR